MTVTANFGLLSSSGSQALQSFYNVRNNRKVLNGISGGFSSNSIFSNSSGISSYSGSGFSELTGMSSNRTSSVYAGSGFGSSLIGNYYNSISSVVLGQQAPTSVFEQRLAYSMGLSSVPVTNYPTGNYSNYCSLASSSKSGAANSVSSKTGSSYNVFSTATNYDYSKAANSQSVSKLMSSLSVMG